MIRASGTWGMPAGHGNQAHPAGRSSSLCWPTANAAAVAPASLCPSTRQAVWTGPPPAPWGPQASEAVPWRLQRVGCRTNEDASVRTYCLQLMVQIQCGWWM